MGKPIIVIAGPTASGKTDVSIEVAKRTGAEIVVADSMQVYRGMDIGTAKAPESERAVLHHCIDLVNPGEPFSSALYQRYARFAFDDIAARGCTAILSGGTGFYIRAAIDDYDFPEGKQVDNPIREKCNQILSEEGAMALWRHLDEIDPKSAADIHPNNSKRVARAIELHASGESYHEQLGKLKAIAQVYPATMICLDVEHDVLAKRISKRVGKMRELGLVDEVKGLLDAGFRDAVTASAAIGYKEIVAAFDGQCSLDQAFDDIATATRRYAKRQRSWFNSDKRYIHVEATSKSTEDLANDILAILEEQGDKA